MKIVNKKLDELIPYENNPRNNDQAVDAVANSIREFGFINPIVIDKNNIVVAGHTRLKAAYKLGLKEAPTIMLENLTEEQINAFRLADNKVAELAEWNEKQLYEELQAIENIDMGAFGFDDDFYFEEETPVFEDDFTFDDEQEETIAHYGDVFQLGNHKLMCGDATKKEDVDKLFKGEVADMVHTDPPYNVAYDGKADYLNNADYNFNGREIINDNLPENEFIEFLDKAFANMANHLKEGGAFYIWHATSSQFDFMQALKDNGIQIRQQLIWVKNAMVIGRQDYQWKHEPCFYGWKDGAGHYFTDDRTITTVYEKDQELEKLTREQLIKLILKERSDKEISTIIKENRPMKSELHPTMKPIDLCARLIRNSSKKGELVYDAFGGSGSTLIACEQLERTCYMMEYDPHYCDVIINRWEEFTGKKAKKLK